MDSLFPKLHVVPPSKANGSHEDSFAGEGPEAGALHQVKLLEHRVSELTRQLEVEKKAGDLREESYRKALDDRDAARAEVAAFLKWVKMESEWEYFRAEMLYGETPKGRISSENAAKLGQYLKDSGHGSEFLAQFKKLEADLETAKAEATEWRARCNSGALGWLAPFDADSLQRDVVRIREERDELRRQVDCLITLEEMAEAVESARNAGIEAASALLYDELEQARNAGCTWTTLANHAERIGYSAALARAVDRIRALKRSTSEKAP